MDKNEKQTTTTRRKFVKTTAVVSTGFMILPRCTILHGTTILKMK